MSCWRTPIFARSPLAARGEAISLTPPGTIKFDRHGATLARWSGSCEALWTPHGLPQEPNEHQKGGHGGDEPTLQRARRADADQVAHEQAEIEATGLNQQALSNVGVAAEVHARHPAGLIEMGEGAFQALSAQAQQPQSACATDAPTIAVHG